MTEDINFVREKSDEFVVPSEQTYAKKGEICVANTIFSTACGLTCGSLLSLLFLRRRMWPLLLGTGFGLGMSYANCQHLLKDPKPLIVPMDKSLIESPIRN